MSRKTRIISIILALAMSSSIAALYSDIFNIKPPAVKERKTAADSEYQIAGDISNITGVKAEVLLAEREKGKSWNDILIELRQDSYNKVDDTKQRNNILTQAGIGENELKKLRELGYRDEEIQEARMLVERVAFQLQEISAEYPDMLVQTKIQTLYENQEDETEKFRNLASKYNLLDCLYLILRLKDDLGGLENALDEYLFCLQVDLDLSLYLADKEEYLRIKEKMRTAIGSKNIITLQLIEEKILESLNRKNKTDEVGSFPNNVQLTNLNKTKDQDSIEAKTPIPVVNLPEIKDILPENPASAIKKEIEVIDPMKNLYGGQNK